MRSLMAMRLCAHRFHSIASPTLPRQLPRHYQSGMEKRFGYGRERILLLAFLAIAIGVVEYEDESYPILAVEYRPPGGVGTATGSTWITTSRTSSRGKGP
jgi:hypothetical protein